jgi:hypothetical protein
MYLLLLLIHVEQYTVMVEAQTFRFSMKKDKSILAVNFCRSNCVLFWIICGNCVKKGVDGVTIMSGLGVVRSHALSPIPLVVPTC